MRRLHRRNYRKSTLCVWPRDVSSKRLLPTGAFFQIAPGDPLPNSQSILRANQESRKRNRFRLRTGLSSFTFLLEPQLSQFDLCFLPFLLSLGFIFSSLSFRLKTSLLSCGFVLSSLGGLQRSNAAWVVQAINHGCILLVAQLNSTTICVGYWISF